MSTAHRVANLLGVFLPAVAVVLAAVLLWDQLIGPEILAIAAVMYLITGMGITVGFHRLLAHRAFETATPTRVVFAVLGSMATQGSVFRWVANHRKHHAFSDEEGDPHSPHLTGHDGIRGVLGGLWHAHLGWILAGDRADRARYVPDLLAEPPIRFVDRMFLLWMLLGLALPFGAGLAVTGTLEGAWLGLLWGGAVRIFFVHHMTFAINSLCHFMGRRRFDTEDEARNLALLAPFTFGESWHNNHHAFPTSAFHGLQRRELDLGGLVVITLERLGLAWNVRRPSLERQQAKLRAGAAASPAVGPQARRSVS